MSVTTTKFPLRGARATTVPATALKKQRQQPSDDDILGLVTAVSRPVATASDDGDANGSDAVSNGASSQSAGAADTGNQENARGTNAIPPELAKVIEANPQVRQAFEEAQAYRAVFASPQAARDAKSQLDELDELFFSVQPGDHAALAARIHDLSPEAFQNFARAMQAHAAKIAAAEDTSSPVGSGFSPDLAPDVRERLGGPEGRPYKNNHTTDEQSHSVDRSAQTSPLQSNPGLVRREEATDAPSTTTSPVGASLGSPAAAPAAGISSSAGSPSLDVSAAQPANAPPGDSRRAAQVAFFHDTNAAAVEQILGAIESQVNHLLPEGISASTRNRIVGEIYREIDATLRANRQLGKQLREAFHAGAEDSAHQRAIVTLVTGRAKQALPSVAKRVIGEWTHGIVAANREKLSRHQAASKRVDIAGGGSSDGVNRKPLSPRDVNYKRLSDSDILNL